MFVVTGTYNEVENIVTLTDRVLSAIPEATVLVVDDNSPDGTADRVTELSKRYPGQVVLIKRPRKLGLGSALRHGMKEAINRGATHIFTIDADLSHRPERLPQMLAALQDCDVVIGSRYVSGAVTANRPWHRRLLSRLGGTALRYFGKLPARDPASGYRGYRAEIVKRADVLNTTSRGYAFQAEALFNCSRAGATVSELPIAFTDREKGSSKMSLAIAWESLCLLLKWIRKRIIRNLSRVEHCKTHEPAGKL